MNNSISSKLYFKVNTIVSQLYLLRHKLFSSSLRPKTLSGFLFTTHKSASSFVPHISRIVASRSKRLLIDYEIASWHLGELGYGDDIHSKLYSNLFSSFNHSNRFYAPLRCPPPKFFSEIFPLNPIMLFLRDPRDLAISAYYSFGSSHPLPTNSESRKLFIKRRDWINSVSIDSFCIEYIRSTIMPIFTDYLHVLTLNNTLYLRYSDYINDPYIFFAKIFNHFNCPFEERDVELLVSIANPVQSTTNTHQHQRSGKLNQYRDVLSKETNSLLSTSYRKLLLEYGFNLD